MIVRRCTCRAVGALCLLIAGGVSAGSHAASAPVPVGDCDATRFGAPAIVALGKDLLATVMGSDCGLVSLLDGRTGAERRRFENPQAGAFHVENGKGFGAALAALGRRVLVAAPNDRTVYAFDARTGRTLQRYLGAGPSHDGFGSSLVGVGKHVVVGASFLGVTGDDVATGGIYVFDTATGTLEHTIVVPLESGAGGFGTRLAALSNDRVVVGTIDGAEGVQGHVFVADLQSGTVPLTIEPPTPAGVESYGLDVAASGDTIVVGVSDFNGPTPTGTVYLYDADTGGLRRTIPSPGVPGEAFGQGLAIRGRTLVVAAPSGFDVSVPGSLYVIDARTGRTRARLELGTDVASASVLRPAFLRRGLAFAVEADDGLRVDYLPRIPRRP
jgi:outer membrane protein assembly factor BamB